MKKVLSSVMAASMAMGLASVAFAATSLTPSTGTSINGTKDYAIDFSTTSNRAEYKLTKSGGGDVVLYNFGDTDEIKVYLQEAKNSIDKIRVDVAEGNVKVNFKKYGTNDAMAQKGFYGLITIKADAGLRDFDEDDFTVDVDVDVTDKVAEGRPTEDYTFSIKGKVAYSHVREVSEDERYANKDSDVEGCMYEFDSVIDEESRIRVNQYVDVFFKGNYGTDKENMRVWTDEISEVKSYFEDNDVEFYDFRATPKFATKVKVVVDADPNSFLYEYDKKTGDVTKIDAKYESNGWAFTTKNLGTYVVTEEEYEDGNIKGEEPKKEDTTTDEPIKGNPGTGASNIGTTAAIAALSLIGVGSIALKKFSK